MQEIILTVGIPASGKSTWAIEQVKAHPNKFIRLNKDDARNMIACGSTYSATKEELIDLIRHESVVIALKKGYSVIIDDTNFKEKHFLDMCDIAEEIGNVTVIEKFFEITLKDALARNKARPNPIPDIAIIKMYNDYVKHGARKMNPPTYFPPNIPNRRNSVGNSVGSSVDKPKALICDLDGTLALNLHGRSYSDWSEAALMQDEVSESVLDMLYRYDDEHKIIFMTGRPESARAATQKWLDKNVGIPGILICRPERDFRSDRIVKRELYNRYVRDNYNVKFAIDDRRMVIGMWRSLGIFTFAVGDTI